MKKKIILIPAAAGLFLLAFAALFTLQYTSVTSDHDTNTVFKKATKMQRATGRFEHEWLMTHDPATGDIPKERLYKAYKESQQIRRDMAEKSGIIPIFWEERGPANVGGRTRAVLVDANDATGATIWAGSVSGGLWRCNDIDANPPAWNVIDDFFSNLAITSIVQDPTNTNQMFFGTGEGGYGNFDAVRGMGVWQSTDGGNNWGKFTPIIAGGEPNINKMLIDNTGAIFAATDAGLYQYNAMTDSWDLFLGNGVVTGSTNVQDIEVAADGTLFAAINSDGMYRFSMGMWSPLADDDLPATGFRRIEIGCAPSNPNVVYSAYVSPQVNGRDSIINVYLSNDGGTTWNTQTRPMNLGGQLWYDLIFGVDPNDATRVWLGGVAMRVSPDSGISWQAVNAGHADNHAIVFRNGDSDLMLVGNDGGVYSSTNASLAMPSVVDKNATYNVTQFYTNALHPDPAMDYYLGGTQDNGTQRFTCAGICDTDTPTGADGAFCFIDQDDPMIQITASQDRVFNLSTDGGASFNNLIGGNTPALFITPADYDNANDILYLSDSADTLGRISDIGGTNTATFEQITQMGNGRASNIKVSPNSANRLFVGVENGIMLQIDNADMVGGMTVNVLNTPFTTYISCIEVEVGNDMHLIASTSSYGQTSVFESTDGGTTWDNVEGNLPDMPVRWCMFHPFDPTQALIATELGVWTTDELDGENTEWFPTNTYGMANVRSDMLAFRPSDSLMVVATHGRGFFSTDYFNSLNDCPTNLMIGGAIAPGIYMAENFINSDGTVGVDNSVIFHAGECITLEPDFHAEAGSYFVAAIQACGPGARPPIAEDGRTDKIKNAEIAFGKEPFLKCSPNPTTFELTINIQLPKDSWYQLYVRNLQGQLMASIPNSGYALGIEEQFALNTSHFKEGMYVMVLQTKDGAVSEKFVVVK